MLATLCQPLVEAFEGKLAGKRFLDVFIRCLHELIRGENDVNLVILRRMTASHHIFIDQCPLVGWGGLWVEEDVPAIGINGVDANRLITIRKQAG